MLVIGRGPGKMNPILIDEMEDRVRQRTAVLEALNEELHREIAAHAAAEQRARQRLNDAAHAERLSTMGEMVSGLAHELNQPLTAIAAYAQVCRHRLRASKDKHRDQLLEAAEQIAEQADRAGQIIRHLRDFVRRADSQRAAVDINEPVRDILVLLEVDARLRDVRLETVLDDSLPRVNVDRVQIEQVITNLVRNAMEAAEEVPRGLRAVTIRTTAKADGAIEVAVEDTGKGLPTKDVGRLFRPFYTTKENGMGLGLSISRSIIEAHGGRLEAVSNAERGATLRFTLPVETQGEQE